MKEILTLIKQLELEGYEFEADEGSLALLIRKILKHEDSPFKIEGYHVSMRRERAASVCQSSVKVLVDGPWASVVFQVNTPVVG